MVRIRIARIRRQSKQIVLEFPRLPFPKANEASANSKEQRNDDKEEQQGRKLRSGEKNSGSVKDDRIKTPREPAREGNRAP